MRVVILTSLSQGYASTVLPELMASPTVEVARSILVGGLSPNRRKLLKRKFAKALKIGPLGTLNGFRMRSWYSDQTPELREVCAAHGVEYVESDYLQSEETQRLVAEARADLGLSLGNGYIPRRIFSLPRLGMINIHTELLPAYQNAQSVIWPIHNGQKETGFTIHQIDSGIDTGRILYQERYPIVFCPTLRETVIRNLQTARERVPPAFRRVCEDFPAFLASAQPQGPGGHYTTPSIWQYLRMCRNNRQMYEEQRRQA